MLDDTNDELHTQIDGELLKRMLRNQKGIDSKGSAISLESGLSECEALQVQKLIYLFRPLHCLEVGMAMGVSTLAILYALNNIGVGTLISIDPHQTGAGPEKWNGIGLTAIQKAGLSEKHMLIEQPSYLALPNLLSQQKHFDFILIDGWHSFDYAFVDYFFSDLLLNDGGILLLDDVEMPQINKVCWFIETHKVYKRIGTTRLHPLNPFRRLQNRIFHVITDRNKVNEWGSMQAYQKLRNTTVPWSFFQSNFYPYFGLYKIIQQVRMFVNSFFK